MTVFGMQLHAARQYGFDASVNQVRAIVAAKTKTAACRIFGCSLYEFNAFGGETWNDTEIAVAMAEPGVMFVAPLDLSRRGGEWKRVSA